MIDNYSAIADKRIIGENRVLFHCKFAKTGKKKNGFLQREIGGNSTD
jgi:hypothetical protein